MIQIDMTGSVVLITGGTKGIGLATALEFAKAGAATYLTYKWGSADTTELFRKFEQINAIPPVLFEADVSEKDDTKNLLAKIAETETKIDVFVSNVTVAQRTLSLDEYKKKSLYKTFDYSTWPMIEYTRLIKKQFGQHPKYIVGVSSDGPDHFYTGYDYVAASKALLEFFAKYLSMHLFDEDCRVNVVRFGSVKTESFSMIFGEEFFDYLKDNGVSEKMILKPEDCGKTILGLCSGYMDLINGQIISADLGMPLIDNSMMRYLAQRENNK